MGRIKARAGLHERAVTEPRELWDEACAYFKWCDDNPILEERLVPKRNGRPYREVVKHPRAYTTVGLCAFTGVRLRTFVKWRDDEDSLFHEVATKIGEIMHEQKFVHAAVGLMNASIVSRDLGLVDKQERAGEATVNVVISGDERDL